MIQANSQHIVAIDSFDPVGAQYMRDVFPGVIEPEHPNFQRLRWNATGLLVGGSSVTREDIDRSPNLRFIVRHGAGYDAVDTKACKARGIIVCNCPGVNAMSVAEVALALTAACSKNLVEVARQIRAGTVLGKKHKSLYSASMLTGKTFGIIGGGAIGQLVAKKFIGAYEGSILMYDPYVSRDGTGPWGTIPHQRTESVSHMLAHVDVLSLHVPLLESTRDLINLANMRTMKPTAIIINTARGGVINEEDLFTALQEGVIAAAGIDAFVHEPPTKKVYGALLDIPTLTFTPHIGAAAAEIQTALCMSMCDHMAELMAGETPRDRVA